MSEALAMHTAFRLAGEPGIAPISTESAAAMMRCWRGMGVWLTFWDSHGMPIGLDAEGPAVWTTLWSRSTSTREAVSNVVRAALSGDSTPRMQPWGDTLGLLPIPMRQRGRLSGVALAGWVRGKPDEDFIRLCDHSQLDVTLLSRMAESVPAYTAADGREWRPLLEHSLQQNDQVQIAAQQIESFTRNLNDTYEELSLIYGIIGALSLTEPPVTAIAQLAEDVLSVTHSDGIYFAMCDSERSLHRYGRLPDNDELLRRLTSDLGVAAAPPPPARIPQHVIRNRVREHASVAWTADFARHVVAFPMRHESLYFGAMIAVNQQTNAEFTSVQIKFLRAVADRLTGFLQNKRLYDDLAGLSMGMMRAFIAAIDAKDPYTCGHSERVARLSRLLAERAGLEPELCERVYLSGLLHDVGKIGVPDAILCKPGKLTEDEFNQLRNHPEIGERILRPVEQIQDLLPGVLHHHERLDGRGYPHRLAGDAVPLFGRIICLADCFDAMTSNRTYRCAMPIEAAMAEVRRCAGTQFDPMLAERFLELDLHGIMQDKQANRDPVGRPAPARGKP